MEEAFCNYTLLASFKCTHTVANVRFRWQSLVLHMLLKLYRIHIAGGDPDSWKIGLWNIILVANHICNTSLCGPATAMHDELLRLSTWRQNLKVLFEELKRENSELVSASKSLSLQAVNAPRRNTDYRCQVPADTTVNMQEKSWTETRENSMDISRKSDSKGNGISAHALLEHGQTVCC